MFNTDNNYEKIEGELQVKKLFSWETLFRVDEKQYGDWIAQNEWNREKVIKELTDSYEECCKPTSKSSNIEYINLN